MIVVFDVEANGLDPDRVWCVSVKEVKTNAKRTFTDQHSFRSYCDSVSCFVGHGILWYDLPVLKKLWGIDIDPSKCIDTLVTSRLVWFERPGGHSVEAWAKEFGTQKIKVNDWDNVRDIELYIRRCEKDVDIEQMIYEKLSRFIFDKDWAKALRMEHDIAVICREMHDNGFAFDIDEANRLLVSIEGEMDRLKKEIQDEAPLVLEKEKPIILKIKNDGEPYANVLAAGAEGNIVPDSEWHRFSYRPINPGSPRDRIEYFWRCGWRPFEKTKGHKQCERKYRRTRYLVNKHRRKDLVPELRKLDDRLKEYETYGWTTSEGNLSTLPDDAPGAARKIATWLCLDGRRGDLVEWIDSFVPDTGRIHGTINSIGAWTHRPSHKLPNTGNIVSSFTLDDIKRDRPTPVELVKANYDSRMRGCWKAGEDRWLTGTDADAIQLRIAAHYINDEEYTHAVAYGNKQDGTDIHSVNARKLGPVCSGRDESKTFIYAWFLGAGTGEVSRILSCTMEQARESVNSFVSSTPGLAALKSTRIPSDAKRGYFDGLDGRKVVCNSEHLMLAGYLQNGEKVIMGHANVIWKRRALKEGIDFWQVNWVHDEWQTETRTEEEAHLIGKLQCEALQEVGDMLNLNIPITGNCIVGKNWLETH